MSWLVNVLSRISLAVCAAMFSVVTARAAVPLLPVCSWPIEVTGQGFLNVATPDTNSTYWIMPVDTGLWRSITFQGTYPNARAFNLTSYSDTGSVIGTLADAQIMPDPGSTNPFATPAASGDRHYTITISASGSGPNKLDAGGSRLVFLVYRLIAPDQGLDRTGGTGLPVARVMVRGGSALQLRPCPFASNEAALGSMIPILVASGFNRGASFLQTILSAAKKHHYLWPDVDADRARYEELRDGRMGQWCGLRTTDIEANGQQELLNWICLAGAMDHLGQRPAWSDFVETYIFNSSKCFAVFPPA
jgi:hypothetical protein